MVAHCFQLKFESLPSPHLHYDITSKFQTDIKNEIVFNNISTTQNLLI